MAFTIEGTGASGPLVATRLRAASAVVLAHRWLSDGVADISIRNDGQRFDIEQFRRRFVFRHPEVSRIAR